MPYIIPVSTIRGTPVGSKMPDGYSTKISNVNNPNISFYEKTVKPPGSDGGDMIDITTMLNAKLRTFYPRSLVTVTECSGTAGYSPRVLYEIFAILNINQAWTVFFPATVAGPAGAAVAFYAALNKFEPQDHSEGSMPEAQFTITPTNTDANGLEALPEYYGVPGTQVPY